jgi:bleomycin hydrolase
MFRLVVPNEYVPAKLMEAFRQAPTMLTYDDPLFAEDE